jgi:hypothetical protein
MTERRDLKRRVRERQARTGESYMTALRHVQEDRPGAIPTIELADLTELGAPLGFKCRLAMFPRLAERVDAAAMLVRLRDALLMTEGDRSLTLMRRVVLGGGRARMLGGTAAALEEARRFVDRAKAGVGGVSESGRMLALQVATRPGRGAASEIDAGQGAGASVEMVLFVLQLLPPFVPVFRDPTLVITPIGELTVDPLFALLEAAPWRSLGEAP